MDSRLLKGSLILSFLTISVVVALPAVTPVNGYEFSIYTSLVPYGAILVGLSYIVHYTLGFAVIWRKSARWKFWMIICSLVALNVVIILLPLWRGYFGFGSADVSRAVGDFNAISSTGHLPAGMVYVLLFSFGATLQSLTNFDSQTLVLVIPAIFTASYPFFMWFLSSRTIEPRAAELASLLSTIFVLSYRSANVLYDPQAASLLYIPFVLGGVVWYGRTSNRAVAYLILPVMLAVPFFHPLTSVVLLATLTVALLINQIWTGIRSRAILALNLLTGIIFTWWFLGKNVFAGNLLMIYRSLIGRSVNTSGDVNVSILASFDLMTLVSRLSRQFGYALILGSIAGLGALYIAYHVIQRRSSSTIRELPDRNPESSIMAATWFLVSSVLQVVHMATRFVPLFIYRFVGPAMAVAPPLAAVVISRIKRPKARYAIAALVIFAALLAVAGTHADPWTGAFNQQVTESDIESVTWANEFVATGSVKSIETRPFRLLERTGGPINQSLFPQQDYLVDPGLDVSEIPPNTYVLISERERIVFAQDTGRSAFYTGQDFEAFRANHSVEKVYSTGSVTFWRVR